MDNKLSYENDEHRLYGCAGMAISLVVYDGEEMLSSISIDNEPDRMFEMSDAFYFSGNPSLSAKAAWSQIVRNFHLTAVMAIGNALCRSLVLENKPRQRVSAAGFMTPSWRKDAKAVVLKTTSQSVFSRKIMTICRASFSTTGFMT